MKFVQRNAGVIVGVYENSQVGIAEEGLADDNAELLAFYEGLRPSVAEVARVAAIDSANKADATINSLRAMTLAEYNVWWAANVTNLAQANNVLKILVRLVLRRL